MLAGEAWTFVHRPAHVNRLMSKRVIGSYQKVSLGGSWVPCQPGFVDTKRVNVGVGHQVFPQLTLQCLHQQARIPVLITTGSQPRGQNPSCM